MYNLFPSEPKRRPAEILSERSNLLQPGEKTQRVVTVLVTWAVLLAIFGLYEWSFVGSQREFLEKESFRTLAAVAKCVTAKVDKAEKSAASFLKLVAKGEPAPRLYSY